MNFGVTFYPDQYPKEIWDKEFSEIRKTGFKVVRFAEMAWDWIEPKAGKFNFAGLDYALGLCQKHHLKVMLGVPVSQAPQWLIKKHPEILPVADDGYVHPNYGPRPNVCRDNPTFKKYAERLTRKIAARYAKHPALLMWQIDNEPGYPPLDLTHNKDYCHCHATNVAFRKWAKEKYLTIENLNKKWGTKFWTGTFSDFSEITTPRAGMWDAGNPHIYLDWYRFKSVELSAWLKHLKKIVREYDKEHKVGTNSFTSIINRIADHRVLAQEMDWFGWDIYPKGTDNSDESLAQIADYWRSVCQSVGAEFVVSELHGGPTVRCGNGGSFDAKEIKKWVEVLAAHGATLIMFHNWRPPLFGSETGGFGLLKPDGTPTERLKIIKEIITSPLHPSPSPMERGMNSAQRKKGVRIAIYYSRSSDVQTYQEEGPPRPCPPGWFSGRGDLGLFYGNNSLAGAYRLLWEENIVPDFLFEKDLEEKIPQYKTIFLTNPYLLSRNQLKNLDAFVKGGGILVSECRCGLKDENAHLYERPLMEKLVGVQHQFTEITKSEFRDVLVLKNSQCKVLERFKDKYPALIEVKHGEGKIIYAAYSAFAGLLRNDLLPLRKTLKKVI